MDSHREHQGLDSDGSVNTSTQPETPKQTQTASWKALFFFTTEQHLPPLFAAIICSLIASTVQPANAFLLGKVLGGFTSYASGQWDADKFLDEERKYALYFVALAAVSWIFNSLALTLWTAFGELQAKGARDRLFQGLLKKDTEWYDMRKNGVGALLPRLQAQMRDLQLADGQPLGLVFTMISEAILSLVQAMVRAWDLTLVILSTTPLIIGILVWLGNGTQKYIKGQEAKLDEAQKHSHNAFNSIETVKCFNGQECEAEKYSLSIYQAALQYFRVANLAGLQMAIAVLLSVSMFVQGFYYGAILVAKGSKNTEDIITTFMSAIGAFQALQALLPQILVLEKGRSAGATMRAVMAEVHGGSSDKDTRGRVVPTKCSGDFDLRNVTFSYPSRLHQRALDDATFFIKGGQFTFLIGKSGSGKSTVGQLFMRFYSRFSGTITLDGTLIENIDVSWLRDNITLVEQTSLLFNDTIFRNIAFGRKDYHNATRSEIADAVEFALLQLMVSDMPDGLETMVGLKGGAMSGGQRQRLALARARLRNTPILILDESTSALDHITRGLMMDAIRQWRHDKTTIVITHDISQIHADDYLYVLETGRIVQEGYRGQLEACINTPFQDFVHTESTKDKRSLTIQHDGDVSCSGHETDHDKHDHSDKVPVDVIDAQLTAAEQKRATHLHDIINDTAPLAAGNRGGGPAASPWLRLAAITSPQSPTSSDTGRWSKNWDRDTTQRPMSLSPPAHSEGLQVAQMLEKFVDTTGRLAAETRRKAQHITRKQVQIDVPSLAVKRKKLPTPNETEDEMEAAINGRANQTLVQILSTVWPSLGWSTRVIMILGFFGAAIHGAGTPAFAFVLSKLLQTYSIPGGDKSKALMYSLVILAIACIDATGTYMFRLFLEWVGQCWVDRIRGQALTRILDQPREFFDKEENTISRLVDSLDRNAEDMRNLMGRFASLGFVAALMMVISLTWALVTSWKLTLISLSVVPYVYLTTRAYGAICLHWNGLTNGASEDSSVVFTETFTNIKTVRALALEDHFTDKYNAMTMHALRIGFRRALYSGIFYGISDSASTLSCALIVYAGSKLAASGTSTVDVVTVFTMLMFAMQQVGSILGYIPQLGNSQDTASRLLRLAQSPQECHEHQGSTQITAIGEVAFTNLSFAYPSRPKHRVLQDLTLNLRPGTTTAIVGGSGSGKSTIANLLLNLYPSPQALDLTISSRPLNSIQTASLRALIVPVAQTPTLFPSTIADNISYGLPTSSPYATSAAITRAATQAGIHSFISSLPQGYETLIGDGGTGLSGGQAQRIAIARALVRRPQVLILDEATSALDVESASLVRDTVLDLVRGGDGGYEAETAQSPQQQFEHARERRREEGKMTVLIITHAREMMEIAERIVVLDHGQMVEVGSFGQLMAKQNGALRNLLQGGEWDEEQQQQQEEVQSGSFREERDEIFGTLQTPGLTDVQWNGFGTRREG